MKEEPKCTVDMYGARQWWLNGKRHREDGPALEYSNRSKSWWLNGKLHRKDGPAVESANGSKQWYLNGKRHRKDGPAIEYANGVKKWYLDGKEYSYEDWLKKINPSCENKVVIIDGQKYKLVAMS